METLSGKSAMYVGAALPPQCMLQLRTDSPQLQYSTLWPACGRPTLTGHLIDAPLCHRKPFLCIQSLTAASWRQAGELGNRSCPADARQMHLGHWMPFRPELRLGDAAAERGTV